MRLDLDAIKAICDRQGTSVTEMLREARVSRNAFYSLARKKMIVPRSIEVVAEHLGVPVSAILDEPVTPAERLEVLAREASRIAASNEDTDSDNLRHTLLLLDEKPVERLRRALRRGRQFNFR